MSCDVFMAANSRGLLGCTAKYIRVKSAMATQQMTVCCVFR